MDAVPLTRATLAQREGEAAAVRPPARIVHLGLGNFFRAHQAWYTQYAHDAAHWGIVAFTGRSRVSADALNSQDGLFSLVERGPDGDRVDVIRSVVEAARSDDADRLVELLSDPQVAIVTLTVTESGYRLTTTGQPDLNNPDVVADLEALRAGQQAPATVLGRLVTGLAARRAADAGPIAIVPCDNIPGNGAFVARGLLAFAGLVDGELAHWIAAHASFVSTSVDRITPRADEPPVAVANEGWIDRLPVVTEPFADWVLAGNFPAGRPAWEGAGARFVEDIEPWENRKLWLLNGAHSILAFAGLSRGCATVAEAMEDDGCRAIVEGFWAEAVTHLPKDIEHERYRRQLVERFTNPRIVHQLDQIALEATTKVEFRFVSVAERTVASGEDATASARAVGSWICWAQAGSLGDDVRAAEVRGALRAHDPVTALIALVSPRLAAHADFVTEVTRAVSAATPVHTLQAED